MNRLKDRIKKLCGTVGLLHVRESIATIGTTVNLNADVLIDLIDEVEALKKRVADLEAESEDKE